MAKKASGAVARDRTDRFCPKCGGETEHRRRWEKDLLVTYLVCRWCDWHHAMLAYDDTTGTVTEWPHGPIVKE